MAMPAQFVTAHVLYRSADGHVCDNVLYYTPGSTLAGNLGAIAVGIATAVNNKVVELIKDAVTVETQFLGVSIRLNSSGVSHTAFDGANAGSGTVLGDTLPDTVARVIRKATNQGGKSGRGRWFIGCVPEAHTENGRLTDAGMEASDGLGAAYSDPVTAGGVVYTPQHRSDKLASLYAITGFSPQEIMGTQRRRRLRPVV